MSLQGSSTLITPPLKSQNLGRLLTPWVPPPPHYESPVNSPISDLPALPVPRCPCGTLVQVGR